MSTKKVLVAVLFAAGIVGTAATPLTSVAAVTVYVTRAPPAERTEHIPTMRHGYMWSPGYWDYRGRKHVWVKGVSVRERKGYSYQPNRWVERDGRWNLERSRWSREQRRDSDGDGVANRNDAHPNNPNRP